MAFNPSNSEWADYAAHINSLPQEEIDKRMREGEEESKRLYEEFQQAFQKGVCDSCGKSLATFSKDNHCFHWLLRPKGVKKGDLEELLKQKGYFRVASYVRWVANEEAFLCRINDLVEEGDANAVFHWSATYKHIKWTFICNKSDLAGHDTAGANFPHYHIEIKLSGQSFVRFNDFHAPFSDEDLFNLKCNDDERFPIKQSFGAYGAGMKDAFSIPPEMILSESTATEDEDKAVYHIQTIIRAEKGQRIKGERVAEMIRRSKETGQPMAHFAREMGLNPQIVIGTPDEVPTKENRNNPRKKKD
jgi:hypothetical protein